ncbi:MAG: hypothetical protein AAF125_25410, partial [Chloroflexota bacterium]
PNEVPTSAGAMSVNEIAAFVDERLADGACLWNWDGLGFINYLSGYGSCTSAPHGSALMVREAFDIPVNRAEYMRELYAARPTLHAVQPIWGYFPELERFAARYRGEQLLTLEETGGFVDVYTVDMSAHTPTDASFGGLFRLIGYDLPDGATVCAGEALRVGLAWQVEEQPTRYYNTFLQLLTLDDGARVAGLDAQPHSDRPTIEWGVPDMIYVGDILALAVPVGVKPGRYRLVNGYYDTETAERLTAYGADGSPLPGDFLALGEVEVVECG